MFKIIKLEIFDSFHCLMDKCSDNCCDEDWTILIDNDTYNTYKEIGIPELEKKITNYEPHVLIKEHGKCPFILPNGLCILHKELGEEYLSMTCKSYPRFVSTYGDLYIENIGLSCPAASDWIVSLDRPCKLVEKTYYENQSEVGSKLAQSEAEINMKRIIDLFYGNTFFDAFKKGYEILGINDNQDIELEFLIEYDQLLCNISICFLFENLMLESSKAEPNYIAVFNKLKQIVSMLETQCGEVVCVSNQLEPKDISNSLYKIMRQLDH